MTNRTILWSTLYLMVAVAGCGPPMSRGEQIAFGAMIGGQIADYESTRKYISIGGTEANPLLGERPDNDSIALLKIGTVLTLWGLGEIWPEHRVPIYSLGAVSGFGAYAWNDRLYEKYKH